MPGPPPSSVNSLAKQPETAASVTSNSHVPERSTASAAGAAVAASLTGQPEQAWLLAGRRLVLGGDLAAARVVFHEAIDAYPESVELVLACAGVGWETGDAEQSETLLLELLGRHPAHAAATLLLARILKKQARMGAVESLVRAWYAHANPDLDALIPAVELLADCGRIRAAADLCESAIASGMTDPRLHAYAATFAMQSGRFDRARTSFLLALAEEPRAVEWQVPNGLASLQRYDDPGHPDFGLFERCLARTDLSARARASVLFALGKAADDVSDWERATACFREGNALVSAFTPWSRKTWRRSVAARLDSRFPEALVESDDRCIPVFILGMPRSGSTLLAERLSRHPDVCDRGELAWLPFFAARLGEGARMDRAAMQAAAKGYLTQLRQDDSDARWFIDKQPMNFLHIPLIRALFPQAHVIHCTRSPRDTALSIWMQYFAGSEEAFAYDFADIAAVMLGCERLTARAREVFPGTLVDVAYEAMVAEPVATMGSVAAALGLSDFDFTTAPARDRVISTSSLWQARQAVHTRSVGRATNYLPHLPELLQFRA